MSTWCQGIGRLRLRVVLLHAIDEDLIARRSGIGRCGAVVPEQRCVRAIPVVYESVVAKKAVTADFVDRRRCTGSVDGFAGSYLVACVRGSTGDPRAWEAASRNTLVS